MKKIRNLKGFTLIELMIVIAIIGILAIVLLPKIGSMKTETKLEGLTTNMRVAEAMVNKIVIDYEASDPLLADIETDVITRLSDVKNPLTDAAAGTTCTAGVALAGAAFVHPADTLPANVLPVIVADGDLSFRGMVGIQAYATGTQVSVKLIPYDNDGNPMVKKIKTINK